MIPNFKNMVYLININQRNQIRLEDLVSLESHILTTLDFDIQFETPNNFLDRYIQLLKLDEGLFGEPFLASEFQRVARTVAGVGRFLCKLALRSVDFLNFMPSQIAAAAALLALNAVDKSPATDCKLYEDSAAQENLSMFDSEFSISDGMSLAPEEPPCVLTNWSAKMTQLTGLNRTDDVRPAYARLIKKL